MKKFVTVLLFLLFAFLLFGPLCDVADACPMCRTANETDDNLPRAYMYSILFMLFMPAMIFTGFGVMFYRLSKQQAEQEHVDLQLPKQDDVDDLT